MNVQRLEKEEELTDLDCNIQNLNHQSNKNLAQILETEKILTKIKVRIPGNDRTRPQRNNCRILCPECIFSPSEKKIGIYPLLCSIKSILYSFSICFIQCF